MNRTVVALAASALLGSAALLFRLVPVDYVPWANGAGGFSARQALVRTLISGFLPPLISRQCLVLQPVSFGVGLVLTSALLCVGGDESCLPGMLLGIALVSSLMLPPLIVGCVGGAIVGMVSGKLWNAYKPNKPLQPTQACGPRG